LYRITTEGVDQAVKRLVTLGGAQAADKVAFRRVVQGAVIGNAVEWYDFAVYGYLATLLAGHFFPSGNETAALLNTFAICTDGMLVAAHIGL
jgi:hypothetical protein